ncbi:hypothetical protein LX36DRAFT_669400 [Colletotrichum falcatum]|nr:hypothetical protein LX36DRAFT_669400 [Colletotrichum falcatum]
MGELADKLADVFLVKPVQNAVLHENLERRHVLTDNVGIRLANGVHSAQMDFVAELVALGLDILFSIGAYFASTLGYWPFSMEGRSLLNTQPREPLWCQAISSISGN